MGDLNARSVVNKFNDGMIHYAAKGQQAKMTAYLLSLDDTDPNQLNKFNESAIFIAAENGDL